MDGNANGNVGTTKSTASASTTLQVSPIVTGPSSNTTTGLPLQVTGAAGKEKGMGVGGMFALVGFVAMGVLW